MRVLIPYLDVDGRSISDPIVSGGVERFIRHLARRPDVDVIEVPMKTKWRASTDAIVQRTEETGADLVVFNRPSGMPLRIKQRTGAHVAYICHHTADGGRASPNFLDCMIKLVAGGTSLWMVSHYQHDRWIELAGRLGVQMPEVSGYVRPSTIDARPLVPSGPGVDVVAVGRCDPTKDPFYAHRVAKKNKLSSVVYSNFASGPYMAKNFAWAPPQVTMWNRPHGEILDGVSGATAAMITWVAETWSIVALEALSLGVPIILRSRKDAHAAEEVSADPSHVFKIPSRDKGEIIGAIRALKTRDRAEIAEATWAKHNRSAWDDHISNFFDRATS